MERDNAEGFSWKDVKQDKGRKEAMATTLSAAMAFSFPFLISIFSELGAD